jgi:hypothetical protein
MQVRAQPDGLSEPVELKGLRNIVILDDYGQPLLVAQEISEGVNAVYRHTDPEFRKVLSAFGIGLNVRYVEGKVK